MDAKGGGGSWQAGRQGGLELPGQKWQICPGAAIVMGGQRGGVLGPLGRSWTHGTQGLWADPILV